MSTDLHLLNQDSSSTCIYVYMYISLHVHVHIQHLKHKTCCLPAKGSGFGGHPSVYTQVVVPEMCIPTLPPLQLRGMFDMTNRAKACTCTATLAKPVNTPSVLDLY
jgi:hypothetical protein